MTDQNQMPMFEDPIPPQEAPVPPKKPRQKPTRKNKTVKVAAPKPVKKRRKRKISKHSALAAPYKGDKGYAGGRYSKDVYAAIASLMGMNNSERGAVLDIVQGLTDGHKD